jgi:hypothetical protein
MRTRAMSRFVAVASAVVVAAACWVATADAAPLTNGGFEAGTVAGWTTVTGGGNTGFATYTGTPTIHGHTLAAPPEGTNGVVSSQTNRGQAILYQDVTLPASGTITISAYVYYQSSGAIATLGDLSFAGSANQQLRIDVINPAAPVDSLAAGDILANVFKTQVGDPTTLAPTLVSADLSAFAGQTVRVRIAEADNQGFFQASADGISISSSGGGSGSGGASRVGYCAAPGNTNPFTGGAIAPGTFLNLFLDQPATDSHYAGATPAIFVQGIGITCDSPPAGDTKQGKAPSALGVPTDFYDYWAKPANL